MKTETTLLEKLAKRAKMNRQYKNGGAETDPPKSSAKQDYYDAYAHHKKMRNLIGTNNTEELNKIPGSRPGMGYTSLDLNSDFWRLSALRKAAGFNMLEEELEGFKTTMPHAGQKLRGALNQMMGTNFKTGGVYSHGGEAPHNPPGNLWEVDPDQLGASGQLGKRLINRNKIPDGYEFSGVTNPTKGRLYNPIGTPIQSASMKSVIGDSRGKVEGGLPLSNSDKVIRTLEDRNKNNLAIGRPDLVVASVNDKYNMNDFSLMKTGGMFNKMQQYQEGGMNLPGGQMQPIPGSDAVEFVGNKHDQAGMGSDSGILLDKNTEVEGGETMDQVTMKKGGERDYFFSEHLKKGGVSYANMHKNILQNGGDQNDIDTLARMQEYSAGRTVDKIAKNGGERKKLEHGGPHPELDDSKLRALIRQQGAAMLENPLLGRQTFREPKLMGRSLSDYPEEKAEEKSSAKDKSGSKSGSRASNRDTRPDLSVASDKYLNEYGTIPGRQPGVKIGDNQYYLDDPELQKYIEEHEDFGEEWMDSIDPKVLEAAGITDYSELTSDPSKVTAYQKAWNAANPDNKVQVDGDFGEQTIRTGIIGGKKEEDKDETDKTGDDDDSSGIKRDPVINKNPKRGPNLVGAAQFIPAAMAFADKPDYMNDADLVKASTIIPERIAKTRLDRVDYNDQLAVNANDAAAMNRFIETSGGGPASMVNRMAMYGKKQQADMRTKGDETRANNAISNQEALLEQQRRTTNAGNAFSASAQNASSQQRASQINVGNKMSVDEFNTAADAATKDRRLMGVDTAVSNLAQMRRDSLQYDSQERLAQAISGQTGVYNREQEEPETAETGGYRKKMGGYINKNKYSKTLKKVSKELAGASKMHAGQSKKTAILAKKMEDKKKMQNGGIGDFFKKIKKNVKRNSQMRKNKKKMGKGCSNSKRSNYTRVRG